MEQTFKRDRRKLRRTRLIEKTRSTHETSPKPCPSQSVIYQRIRTSAPCIIVTSDFENTSKEMFCKVKVESIANEYSRSQWHILLLKIVNHGYLLSFFFLFFFSRKSILHSAKACNAQQYMCITWGARSREKWRFLTLGANVRCARHANARQTRRRRKEWNFVVQIKLCVNQRGAFTCNGISRVRRGRLTMTSSIHSQTYSVAERNGFAQTVEFHGGTA